MRALLPIAVVSILVPSLTGAAENIGVLAVADPPGPGPELVEMTAQLRVVLAERTGGVMDPAQIRERMTGQTSTASLSELDRAFAGALATYQAGDFEGSIRTLRAVIEDLERLPDSPEAFSQWQRANLRLARAEQTLGRRAEAQAILERLVRANPQVKVDATQYPPSFAKQVDEVRAQVKSQKTRRLTVNAQKGVKVFVDGREVGVAPLHVDLPPGRYRVSGAQQNLRVPGVTADLSNEDQTVELDVALAEALRPSAGPGLALGPTDRARRIVATSAWLGLDRVVVATLTQEADVTFLVGTFYDVRRGATQREGRLRLAGRTPPPGGLSALASFLMTGERSSLVAVGGAAAVPVPPPPKPDSKVATPAKLEPPPPVSAKDKAPEPAGKSKAMGWAAFGTGAATLVLTGVSIAAMVKSNGAYDDAKAMLDPSTGGVRPPYTVNDYNSKVSDGDSAKKIGVATGVGAGVCLVATGVLGYLSYKQTGEIGPFRF
jgi:hypothetical protein